MISVIVTLVAIAIVVAALASVDGIPGLYGARACQGASWRHQFPNASKQAIRAFLNVFLEAFAFKDQHRLKFNPEDEVMAIYRSLYPSAGGIDGLELESLCQLLERQYGFQLEPVWHEHITLGEIFSRVLAPNNSLQARRP